MLANRAEASLQKVRVVICQDDYRDQPLAHTLNVAGVREGNPFAEARIGQWYFLKPLTTRGVDPFTLSGNELVATMERLVDQTLTNTIRSAACAGRKVAH
jgi:hypothetical protein